MKQSRRVFSKLLFVISGVCAAGLCFGCGNTSNVQEGVSGITEMSEESKLLWDLPPMVRVNGILYYSTNELVDPPENPNIDGEILSEVDSSEIPVHYNESNFGTGFPYQFGPNKGELVLNIHGKWEIFKSKFLTLERILMLSKKEDLSWDDFDGYYSENIGSGLMILRYDIHDDIYDDLYLAIGGIPGEIPMYFRLFSHDMENYVDIQTEDIPDFLYKLERNGQKEVVVGISAHIKEIKEDSMLVSSDTDEFPGVCRITGIQKFSMEDELQGGTSLYLLMKDLHQKDAEGIPLYHAENITVFSEQEKKRVQPDIFLTSVPEFYLEDLLSSSYHSFAVRSGNYQWTVVKNGEAQTKVACGMSPLEEAAMNDSAKLTLPKYQRLDKVGYIFSTQIAPDILTIRQWDVSDIGNPEAEEERVTTYYYPLSILTLEKGKVYEFSAEWKEDNQGIRRFYATASYVLQTE